MSKTQQVGFRDGTETEGVERGYFESEFFAGERLFVEPKCRRPGSGPRLATPPGTTSLTKAWTTTSDKIVARRWNAVESLRCTLVHPSFLHLHHLKL